MNKEFIPYELALEMFNIGFDEPCVKFQWIDQDKPKWMGVTNLPSALHTQKKWTELYNLYTISIPTFSQCFRWFREKYFIHYGIDRDYYIWDYELYNFKSGNKHIPTGFKTFDTYEEAELACLKKIIEIVKEK